MNEIYETQCRVGMINTDLFGLCRPSSVMNFMQEAATEHTILQGVSAIELAKKQAIWMLVRMRYMLLRPIRGGEHLTVRTWGRPPKGAFVLRDFELYAGEERVGEAVSVWVLGDLKTHTLLRAEDILSAYGTIEPEHPMDKPGKIRMPREMDDAGERHIVYSETDINGHANNTRYADYACDAIHLEKYAGQYVRQMQITYSAECLAGQTVHMLSKQDGNCFYVRGVDKEGKSHFDIRMELAEI